MSTILTFAELQFLLSGSARREMALAALRLPSEAQAFAGPGTAVLASLSARGLATVSEEGVLVTPIVRAVIGSVAECDQWLDLLFRRESGAMSLMLGSTHDGRRNGVLVSCVAPGCFGFDILDPTMSAIERLTSVVESLVAGNSPSIMFVESSRSEGRSVAIGQAADGVWRWAEKTSHPALTTALREEAMACLRSAFVDVLPAA